MSRLRLDDFPLANLHPCLEYDTQPAASSHTQDLGRSLPIKDLKVSK